MPRRNGSYFGLTVNPTPSVASGIWRVREAEEFLRVNKWPATPGVPGSPVASAGNAQVSLAWSAPTLGSPPTDYQVQYSSNSGSAWTTFADGTSTETSAVVTGLTNGTGYIFRVRAVNALGEGPYGAASGVVTPSELDVALLLHFDGTNGSTTFTDSSGNDVSVSANGGAEISTAQSKFGGASGYFDGSGDYISLPFSLSFSPVGSALTIECWLRPDDTQAGGSAGNGNAGAIVSLRNGPVLCGYEFSIRNNKTLQLLAYDGDFWALSIPTAASETALVPDQWSHVALVITSTGSTTLYINGVADASFSNINVPYASNSSDTTVFIGEGGDGQYHGYIDELRIVTGTAVYTANFTPPTAPF
jgi:hypothetical protein